MKIVVCIRQGLDGEINPFDACAYESALQITGAEITLLSMGPQSAQDFLLRLTRLGAQKAILLSDKAFAGADTLATAYTLSLAIKKISPDLVLCGRQTLVGDTAQTAPMLATLACYGLITNVMQIRAIDTAVTCTTRTEGEQTVALPALLTIERINTLRLPRLRSKLGEVVIWTAADLDADLTKCGLQGSPTRVLKTFENESGKRRCQFISRMDLDATIKAALQKSRDRAPISDEKQKQKLSRVCTVTDAPRGFAETVSDDIITLELTDANDLAKQIQALQPSAVLWGSDAKSKRIAAQVAAMLSLGLCADCTRLETDGETLYMYRPALSGSIIAKIHSLTSPAMATVRTEDGDTKDIIVGVGFGVKDRLDDLYTFAKSYNAELAATRKMTDNGITPYEWQVGLTGKTVAPPVYIAVGISGAVHHIVGMERAGTVIAINPDKNAPIFDYADYGITEEFS